MIALALALFATSLAFVAVAWMAFVAYDRTLTAKAPAVEHRAKLEALNAADSALASRVEKLERTQAQAEGVKNAAKAFGVR